MQGMDGVLPSTRVWHSVPPRWAFGLLFLLGLATLLLGLERLWPREVLSLPQLEDCRLDQGSCRADLGEGAVLQVDVEPRPILPAEPITIELELEGLAAKQVTATFRGATMNMGLVETKLAAKGQGRFAGKALLPVCVSGRMDWELAITIESGRKLIRQPFRFQSGA